MENRAQRNIPVPPQLGRETGGSRVWLDSHLIGKGKLQGQRVDPVPKSKVRAMEHAWSWPLTSKEHAHTDISLFQRERERERNGERERERERERGRKKRRRRRSRRKRRRRRRKQTINLLPELIHRKTISPRMFIQLDTISYWNNSYPSVLEVQISAKESRHQRTNTARLYLLNNYFKQAKLSHCAWRYTGRSKQPVKESEEGSL